MIIFYDSKKDRFSILDLTDIEAGMLGLACVEQLPNMKDKKSIHYLLRMAISDGLLAAKKMKDDLYK